MCLNIVLQDLKNEGLLVPFSNLIIETQKKRPAYVGTLSIYIKLLVYSGTLITTLSICPLNSESSTSSKTVLAT